MKVSELQEFLKGLVSPLQTAGARAAANEIERARAGLDPFRDMAVGEFADFLSRAHRYAQDGAVPAKGKSKGKVPALDAEKVRTATQGLQDLYEQALEPTFQLTVLDAALKKIEKQLNKDEAIEVARQMSITIGLKTKKEAFAEIRRKIARGRDTLDRVEAETAKPAAAPAEPATVS